MNIDSVTYSPTGSPKKTYSENAESSLVKISRPVKNSTKQSLNIDNTFPLPLSKEASPFDDETASYYVAFDTPRSVNSPHQQEEGSGLFHCIAHHHYGRLLDTPFANLLSIALSVPENINSVLSTYPTLISEKDRLNVVSALGNIIYAVSFSLNAKTWKENEAQFISEVYNKIRVFSNNFNFSFDTVCRLVGEFYPGVYPNNFETDCLSGGIILSCLLYASYMAYKANPGQNRTQFQKILQALSSTFAAGAFIGNCAKLFAFSGEESALKYAPSAILVAQLGALIFYIIRVTCENKNINKMTQRIGTINNIFSNIIYTVETYETQNIADIILSSSKFLFIGMSGYMALCWPNSLAIFKRP